MTLLTKAQKAECVRLRVEERLTNREIERRAGVGRGSVSRIVKDYPLTAEERRAVSARTALRMRQKAVANGKMTGAEEWTAQEDATLRSDYPRAGRASLMEAVPGRSWGAICYRANTLGVRRLRGRRDPVRRVDPLFETLRDARMAAGIMQQALADKIGVWIDTLCAWETGRIQPTWPMFRAWLAALGINIDLRPIERPKPQLIPWEGIKPLTRDQLMGGRAA